MKIAFYKKTKFVCFRNKKEKLRMDKAKENFQSSEGKGSDFMNKFNLYVKFKKEIGREPKANKMFVLRNKKGEEKNGYRHYRKNWIWKNIFS